MTPQPLLIYVPGLLPKPEPAVHRAALLRCLLAGIERVDPDTATALAAKRESFEIVSWTYGFYGEHREAAQDAAAIDALIAQQEVTEEDLRDATSFRRRLARSIFALGDMLPFLIPHIANEQQELHLRDLRRYVRNGNGVAESIRGMLKERLREGHAAGRPMLLIAHSMGSVIAFEALWQLSRAHREPVQVDLLLTMGSPLGQRYIQNRLKNRDAIGKMRYPDNIRRWINLSAVGDLTAIDTELRTDFGRMVDEGLVETIDDRLIYNWFRLDGELNTHAEYGYLINPETAAIVSNWWRAVSPDPGWGE